MPIQDFLLASLPVLLVIVVFVRLRSRRGRVGPGAIGTVYDMLNEDKRNAVEVIVEQRAAEKDPEDKDGNLPDLEKPR
jgi:hypothetical protein